MSTLRRPVDPRRLDIAAAARDGASLDGRWPLAGFERLADAAPAVGEVAWSARAALRRRPGTADEPLLHLDAQAVVHRVCQRCLLPLALTLAVERDYAFVVGEDRAAAQDADRDDEDVLALTRSLDLHALVEDELLLALPLVPRHDDCAAPAAVDAAASPAGDQPAEDGPAARANPFAALATLVPPRRDDPP